jgi:hypothetical protein
MAGNHDLPIANTRTIKYASKQPTTPTKKRRPFSLQDGTAGRAFRALVSNGQELYLEVEISVRGNDKELYLEVEISVRGNPLL